MTIVTEDSIRTLLLNSEAVMFGQLDLTKHTLEALFESDNVQISKEELSNDVLKIDQISEQLREAETPYQKFDVYYSGYRPFSERVRAKYRDFLTHDVFRKIEVHEHYMDGLKELIGVQGINNGNLDSIDSSEASPELIQNIQLQKNQAAIDWSRSRLEQIEKIRKVKG